MDALRNQQIISPLAVAIRFLITKQPLSSSCVAKIKNLVLATINKKTKFSHFFLRISPD
jgi:hypothetical protein